MNDTLENITMIIDTYNGMTDLDGHELNYLLKDLTTNLFYLEKFRAEYHDKYEKTVHKLVAEKSTVARAVNEANVVVPEMYLLRRIMDAGYKCADAMRSNLSFIKQEMFNSKNHE